MSRRRFFDETSARLWTKLPQKVRNVLEAVGKEAQRHGYGAWLVGGCVRDVLLNRPVQDVDVVVEGDAVQVAERLAKRYGGKMKVFGAFKTALWASPWGRVDIARARVEHYPRPGALPVVAAGTLRGDLFRRDFTFNAMALALETRAFFRLVDPFGGWHDLKNRWVRILHERSFEDDPTRIYRALRFARRLEAELTPFTRQALQEAVAGGFLKKVSGERLRQEILKVFQEKQPLEIMEDLEKFGVWRATHSALSFRGKPSVTWKRWIKSRFFSKMHIQREEVYFSLLGRLWCGREWKGVQKRLALSRHEAKVLSFAGAPMQKKFQKLDPRTPLGVFFRVLKTVPPEAQAGHAAWLSSPLFRRWREYLQRKNRLRRLLTGDDLKKTGFAPGPSFRRILDEFEEAQIEGKIRTRKQALCRLRRRKSALT